MSSEFCLRTYGLQFRPILAAGLGWNKTRINFKHAQLRQNVFFWGAQLRQKDFVLGLINVDIVAQSLSKFLHSFHFAKILSTAKST